jgi:hypothetical protein
MTTNRWMTVKISEGLFPSERTVKFATADGEVSVFVSSNQIEDSKLRVTILDQDSEFALVQVPSQSGTTIAKVSRREILAEPT